MKTARINTGSYTVTGYTKTGNLVQYEVERNASWWVVSRLVGQGLDFPLMFDTKAQALKAIKEQ